MKPRYTAYMTSKSFGTTMPCLGQQLIAILDATREVKPELVWYAADVECTGVAPVPTCSPTPVRIGDASTLIESARHVDQFTRGVFAGVAASIVVPAFRAGGLWTEDVDDADLGDASVEIRAFDTSYWLVTCRDADVAERMQSRFHATNTAPRMSE